jgi:hypothetical protein
MQTTDAVTNSRKGVEGAMVEKDEWVEGCFVAEDEFDINRRLYRLEKE